MQNKSVAQEQPKCSKCHKGPFASLSDWNTHLCENDFHFMGSPKCRQCGGNPIRKDGSCPYCDYGNL